jgi:hypothetical protein
MQLEHNYNYTSNNKQPNNKRQDGRIDRMKDIRAPGERLSNGPGHRFWLFNPVDPAHPVSVVVVIAVVIAVFVVLCCCLPLLFVVQSCRSC